jgi:peptidoglycan/xylan/chitin deacetylase (PgdA/CDA1 family)
MLKRPKTVRTALLLLLLIFTLTGCASQETRCVSDSVILIAQDTTQSYFPVCQSPQMQPLQMATALAVNEQPVAIPAAENQAAQAVPSVPAVDPKKPMVALTFDDGPHNTVTPAILDELKKADGHATFFVVGKRSAGLSYILKRMAAEGNEVANHSYSHPNLARLSATHIRSQISMSDAVIEEATGSRPRLVRAPYGAINERVKQNIDRPLIMWSIDTKDWKTRNSQKTVSIILNNVRDGDIILMHDIYPATGAAAAAVIPKLKEKGFQLVTVSELMQAKGIQAGAGQIVYKGR